ncbi:MAG: four helix bundle protein [Candidatus Saccharibacteria bacterium]|jgi:four helix bundle protein|nr:four helix bundle protein [Patescibacteria group bacterium]
MPDRKKQYDLEERTALFGQAVLIFCQELRPTIITKPLISQIVRSATSIGANYQEANGASSEKDFRYKIHICKKEAQETKHWLRMFVVSAPEKVDDINVLLDECQQLVWIFQKITSTLNNKN